MQEDWQMGETLESYTKLLNIMTHHWQSKLNYSPEGLWMMTHVLVLQGALVAKALGVRTQEFKRLAQGAMKEINRSARAMRTLEDLPSAGWPASSASQSDTR